MAVKRRAAARSLPTKHKKALGWSDALLRLFFSASRGLKSYAQPLSLLVFKDPTPGLQGKFLMKR